MLALPAVARAYLGIVPCRRRAPRQRDWLVPQGRAGLVLEMRDRSVYSLLTGRSTLGLSRPGEGSMAVKQRDPARRRF